jgi:hypothetical protein
MADSRGGLVGRNEEVVKARLTMNMNMTMEEKGKGRESGKKRRRGSVFVGGGNSDR